MASKMSLPFGKKNAAPVAPTKTTMNLAIREVNEADRKSNIAIAVIAILAIVLLGKFGFFDVYQEWQSANDAKNSAQQDMMDAQLLLATYQNTAERYSHYFSSFLTDEELFGVARGLCAKAYDGLAPAMLPLPAKKEMAIKMHYDYKATLNQVRRIFRMDPAVLKEMFPRAAL